LLADKLIDCAPERGRLTFTQVHGALCLNDRDPLIRRNGVHIIDRLGRLTVNGDEPQLGRKVEQGLRRVA
jgi:hypothetical protein